MDFIFFWIFDFLFFISFTSFLIVAFIGTESKKYTRGEACIWHGMALLIGIWGLFITSASILKLF